MMHEMGSMIWGMGVIWLIVVVALVLAAAATGLVALPVRIHGDAMPSPPHKRTDRSRSALPITETELSAIASAATIGLSKSPSDGYSTPAAIGTPATL